MRVHLLGVAVLVTSGGACRPAAHGAVTLGGLAPDSSPAVDEAESEVEAGVEINCYWRLPNGAKIPVGCCDFL